MADDVDKLLGPNWGKINGEDHPDTTTAAIATKVERERCIALCEGWIGTFQDREIKYTTPREYAVGAIEDIIDLIRSGHRMGDPVSSQKDPQ